MKLLYKIVKEGKTYTFTTIDTASLLLHIPKTFVNFNKRQMEKYNIELIEVYDFKTQTTIQKRKELTRCCFCKATFVKTENQHYCQYCGTRLWSELTYNAMQKMYGKLQDK